jgi:hypothetical protein
MRATERVQGLLAKIQTSAVAADGQNFQHYCEQGEAAALRLGNRGPLRFLPCGRLHPDIVQAYWRCGFYVLEGAIESDELNQLTNDFEELITNAPGEGISFSDPRVCAHKFILQPRLVQRQTHMAIQCDTLMHILHGPPL